MASAAEPAEAGPTEGDVEPEVEEFEVVNGVEIKGKVTRADANGDLPLMRQMRDLLYRPVNGTGRVLASAPVLHHPADLSAHVRT